MRSDLYQNFAFCKRDIDTSNTLTEFQGWGVFDVQGDGDTIYNHNTFRLYEAVLLFTNCKRSKDKIDYLYRNNWKQTEYLLACAI